MHGPRGPSLVEPSDAHCSCVLRRWRPFPTHEYIKRYDLIATHPLSGSYLKRAASEASQGGGGGGGGAPARLTSVHHLLSAFEAGIIMVFLTNPLWLIKTRMQLQPTVAAAGGGGAAGAGQQEAYRGLLHAVRTIVREEGARGLYKGECVMSEWMGAAASKRPDD